MNLPADLVLDTSVLLKWFLQQEVLADRALDLRAAYLAGVISIQSPILAIYEFTNALRYKNDWRVTEIQQATASLWEMQIRWFSINAAVIQRSIEIAHTYNTSIYDATFVALAENQERTLVTADQKLVQLVSHFQFVQFLGDVKL